MQAVPAAFASLTRLTSLCMGDNRLLGGRQHLAQLAQSLQYLMVYSCELEEVPEVLSQLTALTKLFLMDDPAEHGWKHFDCLVPLQRLQLLV